MAIPSLLELAVDGASLALRFSEALSTVLPSINRFAVLVNGKRVYASSTAASLSADGTTIRFSLASPVAAGATVTLTYGSANGADRPGNGDIRSASTNERAAFFRASTAVNLSGTAPQSLVITADKLSLKAGETSTLIFSFSRDPGSSFSLSDVTVLGGSLSGLTATADPKVYTATFTPAPSSSGTSSITVAAGSYTDSFGTPGAAAVAPAIAYDTLPPTLSITSDKPSLKVGETATISFTFSEAPIGFLQSDIAVSGGTLSGLTATSDPTIYTATFTPTPNSSGNASISVPAGSYTDAAGNPGGAGASPSLSYDTLAPTLSISSSTAALSAGQTATITFSFSEPPSGFTAGGITTSGGALSGLAVTTDPKVYTAVFTPTANSSGNASISVPAASYTDAAGNPGGAGASPSLSYDTLAPTLTITSDKPSLSAGETATISFAFSEPPLGFLQSDIAVSGGTISGLTTTSNPAVYTATFTPPLNSSGSASITVAAGAYTDAAGNPGAPGVAPALSYDTRQNNPPIVSAIDVTGAVTELLTPVGNLTDSGTLTFTDEDLTDIHTIGTVTPSSDALGVLTASVTTDTTGSGIGGVITWNYSVAASAVEYLAKDQTKVETFTFHVLDGNGASVERTITVTITGRNDDPVITSQPTINAATSSVTIGFTDVDTADTHRLNAGATALGIGTLTSGTAFDLTAQAGIILGMLTVVDSEGGEAQTDTEGRLGTANADLIDLPTAPTKAVVFAFSGVDTLRVNTDAIVDLSATLDQTAGDASVVTGFENVDASGSSSPVSLTGDSSANVLTGGAAADLISGEDGDDTLSGGGGDDSFRVTAGVDTITDLSGSDGLIVSSGATANATVISAYTPTSETSNSGTVNVSTAGFAVNLSALTSTHNGFTVTNSGGATSLIGSAGADRLIGGDEADTLSGGAGADTLHGGAGSDLLYGFSSSADEDDSVIDTATYDSGTIAWNGTLNAWQVTNGLDVDTLYGVEKVLIGSTVTWLVDLTSNGGIFTTQIQTPLNNASPGDTVLVAPTITQATYSGNINVPIGVTLSAPLEVFGNSTAVGAVVTGAGKVVITLPETTGTGAFNNRTVANSGINSNTVNDVFAIGQTIYAATATGLSISTNGGSTFTGRTTANGLGSNAVNGIYAAGSNVYAATNGGLGISTNGGAGFTNKTTTIGLGSNTVYGVFVDGSTIYAATSGGLSISTNGGSSFLTRTTAQGLGSNNVYAAWASGTTVYAATGGGLAISTNGGTSFTNKTTTAGLGSNSVYDIWANGTNVYAATSGGLGVSTDGGISFANKTTTNTTGLGSNTINGVFASGGALYASTGNGLSISTDNGNSFTRKTTTNGLGSNTNYKAFMTSSVYPNKVVAGTSSGLSIASAVTPIQNAPVLIDITLTNSDLTFDNPSDDNDTVVLLAGSKLLLGTGTLTVSDGTLNKSAVSSGDISYGNIVINSTIVITASEALNFSGVVSGGGKLVVSVSNAVEAEHLLPALANLRPRIHGPHLSVMINPTPGTMQKEIVDLIDTAAILALAGDAVNYTDPEGVPISIPAYLASVYNQFSGFSGRYETIQAANNAQSTLDGDHIVLASQGSDQTATISKSLTIEGSAGIDKLTVEAGDFTGEAWSNLEKGNPEVSLYGGFNNDVLTIGSVADSPDANRIHSVVVGDVFDLTDGQICGDDVLYAGPGSARGVWSFPHDQPPAASGERDANLLYGDAKFVGQNEYAGSFTGGDDVIIGGTNIAGSTAMFGDAYIVSSGVMTCGDDTLISGVGSDFMWGDVAYVDPSSNGLLFGRPNLAGSVTRGADRFVFAANNGRDTICDFEVGKDKIDVTALTTTFDALLISGSGADICITPDPLNPANTIRVIGVTSLGISDFIFS